MRTKSAVVLTMTALALAALSGCTTPGIGGSDYTYSQVRGEQSVRLGVIESIRKVRIQSGEPGAVGMLAGAVGGAALGHTMGQGNGNAASTILGTIAGAAAGDALQNTADTQEGLEITVRLDSGYVIAVTQGADEAFRVGDRVQVLGGGGATRVTRLDPASSLNNARPMGPPPAPSGSMPPRNAPPPAPPANSAPGGGNDQIMYFCPDSNAYYPAVPSCKSPWMKVLK
jgi:outer membrane lipoprotein SlyB